MLYFSYWSLVRWQFTGIIEVGKLVWTLSFVFDYVITSPPVTQTMRETGLAERFQTVLLACNSKYAATRLNLEHGLDPFEIHLSPRLLALLHAHAEHILSPSNTHSPGYSASC